MKKLLMVLCMAVFMGLCLASAGYAAIELTDEEEALLAKEPVMNQADLDVFLEYLPRLMEAGQEEDEAPVMEIIGEMGWNRVKAAYYSSKVSLGYTSIIDPEGYNDFKGLGFIPEFYFPTPEELELVKQNQTKVDAIMTQFRTSNEE